MNKFFLKMQKQSQILQKTAADKNEQNVTETEGGRDKCR